MQITLLIGLALFTFLMARFERVTARPWIRWLEHLGLYFVGYGLYRFCTVLIVMERSREQSWTHVVVGFAMMDLIVFLVHWLHHRVGLLWSLHSLHHSDGVVDVVTAYRANPLQWISIAVLETLLAKLLRIPAQSVLIYGACLPFVLVWHHAAIKLPGAVESFLNWILVTPTWHLAHHHPSNQRANRHFGSLFSVWDRLVESRQTVVQVASILALSLSLGSCTSRTSELQPITPAMDAEIKYGKELFDHTARYLGPRGTTLRILGSRMTCQNCHLNSGQKPYGISLVATHVRYPSYRAREGRVLTVADRINNCIERPLNGKPLPLDSREIRALQSYFYMLARGRVVGGKEPGDQLNDIVKFPTRAADPKKGAALFAEHCIKCHGVDGRGKLNDEATEFVYPPLWGSESFQAGSNMNRISKMAGFIKANMPLGATFDRPTLSDEQAFDVAAFVLDDSIHPRPQGRPTDFPNLAEKPIDYSRGPYLDGLSEHEHKFGPFPSIIEGLRKKGLPVSY